MAELGLQYGVLSTYDNHWLLCPYAYLVHITKDDPESSHPNIIPDLIRRTGGEK
ncbi:18395_t:CDS:2 [Gigaspora rosea]|nr:18395_t:CDS:2 [Gigaspora rosea]